MAMLPEKASAGVGPSSPAEASVLKGSLRQQGGANFLVDTPTRWVAEIPNQGGAAYYVFWAAGSSGCFATLQLTAGGVQELGPLARQIAETAGAGR